MKINSKRNKEILKKGKIFAGYFLANYPTEETFFNILKEVSSQIDILELGYPSSNPELDGKIIKEASKKINIDSTRNIEFWRKIRKEVINPIWIMGYAKDLINSKFYLKLVKENLIDGILIPDISLEQQKILKNTLKGTNVDMIYFLKNDSVDDCERIFKENIIIYFQLLNGQTGSLLDLNNKNINICLEKKKKENFILGGFGINTSEKAKEVLDKGFDGIVIGSTLIEKINMSLESLNLFVQEIYKKMNKENL